MKPKDFLGGSILMWKPFWSCEICCRSVSRFLPSITHLCWSGDRTCVNRVGLLKKGNFNYTSRIHGFRLTFHSIWKQNQQKSIMWIHHRERRDCLSCAPVKMCWRVFVSEFRQSNINPRQSNQTCLTTSLFSCQRDICGTQQQSCQAHCTILTKILIRKPWRDSWRFLLAVSSCNWIVVLSGCHCSGDLVSNQIYMWKLVIYRPITLDWKHSNAH